MLARRTAPAWSSCPCPTRSPKAAVNLYVYYRVRLGTEDRCRAAVTAMQAELGMPWSLLRRADDPLTWMEIYENVDAAFVTALEDAARRHGLAGLLGPDGRHLERFLPCA